MLPSLGMSEGSEKVQVLAKLGRESCEPVPCLFGKPWRACVQGAGRGDLCGSRAMGTAPRTSPGECMVPTAERGPGRERASAGYTDGEPSAENWRKRNEHEMGHFALCGKQICSWLHVPAVGPPVLGTVWEVAVRAFVRGWSPQRAQTGSAVGRPTHHRGLLVGSALSWRPAQSKLCSDLSSLFFKRSQYWEYGVESQS